MKTKTWKTFVTAALLGPAIVLVGCKGDGEPDGASSAGPDNGSATNQPAPDLAQPVTILDSKAGNSEALALGVKLVRTQAEYDALGDPNIFAGVDFDQNDLVIAALGQQSTGGYAIKITSIQRVGDELAVNGKATRPGAIDSVTQALTHPYDAVVIPNTKAKSVVPYID